MLALIQRVTSASVTVNSQTIGQIEHGILALIGIEKTDTEQVADKLLEKMLNYRIFSDDAGKMNLNVKETKGGLLLVSQFTLVANTQSGTRPGFSTAMAPQSSKVLFDYLCRKAKSLHQPLATGEFGAHMQVTLCNDGPVTFLLKI
ncbi:MAG: D-aminoacyl-tRNA deacylase [Gammaproteobacteria bacterium]|nr:D-aminoacyl-tRNA deacylase [Gammaproteobacteria bacterium]